MALEFLVNPRSAPRARARCRFSATAGGVAFHGPTEDIGPHGCQLVAPRPVPKGSAIQVVLRSEEGGGLVEVAGLVAWVSPQAPWRLGIAFAEAARPAATRFFDALVASQPGLAGWRQVPDRISLDAMIWLAPPPKLVVDFNADEVAVLTAIGTGATVFELKSRLRSRWAVAERAFFSLLASRYLTLARGGAVPFANWAGLLRELQAEVAAAELADPTPQPPRAAAPARTSPAAPLPPPPPVEADGAGGLDIDPDALELDLGPGQGHGARGTRPAAPGASPAARARSREAEEAWQQALQELAAGHTVSATALLRTAMALAPGDPEIARTYGEIAFGRR
jgi:PilZ domain-containing protein